MSFALFYFDDIADEVKKYYPKLGVRENIAMF